MGGGLGTVACLEWDGTLLLAATPANMGVNMGGETPADRDSTQAQEVYSLKPPGTGELTGVVGSSALPHAKEVVDLHVWLLWQQTNGF